MQPRPPSTLQSRNNLALAYQEAGRAADAIPLHEQTLADRSGCWGPDHPSTLASRNNLALAYQEAGRAADAIPLHEQTVAALERVPTRHPDLAEQPRQRLPSGAPGGLKLCVPRRRAGRGF